MLLVVDNGSVFTKNILEFLAEQKINFMTKPFDKIDFHYFSNYDSFILSGRLYNNKKMNSINSKIIKYAILENKSLLGICYGAEMLALTVGGTIKKMNSFQKGKNFVSILRDNPLYANDLEVYESHNYEISKIPSSIEIIGNSSTCKNEIIRYSNSNIFGTQFHPEMTENGQRLIQNFCNL